ncbi:M20 family metallopeptidase [Gemmatimonadota bacterium]
MQNRIESLPVRLQLLIPAACAVLLLPASTLAQPGRFDERIARAITGCETSIIEIRHQIHANPELGNREFETAALVAGHLTALGLEVKTGVAHTGVVGLLRGGRPGPVVAVRADMDALPVTEETDLPFRSTKRTTYNDMEVGVMHACGHDIHTSVLMGVATVLTDLKEELAGSVLFIFQPAEEGSPAGESGGASLMLEEGLFEGIEPVAVFALHIDPQVPAGDIVYSSGPALAASDGFSITVTGKQTHAARPHTGIDPIVMASQLVLALQTITSRTLDPLDSCVVTVGMFHGGERSNIIPENVRLTGTVRSYSDAVRDTVEQRMTEIVDGITAAGGGTGQLRYSRGLPPTINDPDLVRSMIPTLQTALGVEHVIEGPPWMASEDFSYYARLVPGFIFFLGTLKEGTISGDLHNPAMRADDSAVPIGIRALSNLVIDRLMLEDGKR